MNIIYFDKRDSFKENKNLKMLPQVYINYRYIL